jgi:2'-phosphotransferase
MDSVVCVCCGGSGKVVVIGVCPLCDGAGKISETGTVPTLSAKAAKARAKGISQTLSSLLRHQAQAEGIAIDAQGWVCVHDALKFVNGDAGREGAPVTLDEIRAVVAGSDKGRFALWERTPLMIRACQGHSMKGIVPDLDPLNIDEVPVGLHGTYNSAWEAIKSEGLKKMERNHIHLAKDLPGESGVISGMRADCKVLIWVDLVKATAAGIAFVQSQNGVILSEGKDGVISPEYFSKVVDRTTGKSLL